MSEVRMSAEPRTEFGKGAARRTRRADKVPAVLYGHGEAPRHIALPGHALMLALKSPNVLLQLDLEGGTQLALPRDVQRDPIKGFLEHVDLILVRRGEKVTVEVAIVTVGNAAPETLVTVESTTLTVEAEATHIPTQFEVSVEGLQAGTQIHAKDVTLPEGTVLVVDEESLVVNVTAALTAEQVDAELAGAEAELGIEHDAPEAAAEGAVEETGDAAESEPSES